MGAMTHVTRLEGPAERLLLDGSLDEDDLELLLRGARCVEVAPRHRVLHGSEDRLVLVLEGAVMSHLGTREGEEVITAISGPGTALGLAVVLGGAATDEPATSLTPTCGVSLSGPRVREMVAHRPGIASACLATAARQLADAATERSRFAGTDVSTRVHTRLLELATRWGRPREGRLEITLRLTQSELAAWSGASRESVAKVLHRLRERGIVDTGRRTMVVHDLDALRARATADAGDDARHLLQRVTSRPASAADRRRQRAARPLNASS